MDRPRAFGPVAPWPSAACGYWQPGARHPLSPPSPPTSALLLLLLYVRAYSFHHGRRHLSARRAARHGARVLGFPPFANLPRTAANRGCARSMRLPRLRAQLHALPHCHVAASRMGRLPDFHTACGQKSEPCGRHCRA